MCRRNNIIYQNGAISVQRRPTFLRQLADHIVSKRRAKKALARTSPIETSPANQFLFENEMPLEGGQRVITSLPAQSELVDEEKERTEQPRFGDSWEKEFESGLPDYR
ncbi:hypothetical protein EG329_012344 [Mollisiaceae sp. DMI_Dod_QoI]|nr:hypothetical protein EG329_012344 [Helotiales sp. DMI_Dod_QoI]